MARRCEGGLGITCKSTPWSPRRRIRKVMYYITTSCIDYEAFEATYGHRFYLRPWVTKANTIGFLQIDMSNSCERELTVGATHDLVFCLLTLCVVFLFRFADDMCSSKLDFAPVVIRKG